MHLFFRAVIYPDIRVRLRRAHGSKTSVYRKRVKDLAGWEPLVLVLRQWLQRYPPYPLSPLSEVP